MVRLDIGTNAFNKPMASSEKYVKKGKAVLYALYGVVSPMPRL